MKTKNEAAQTAKKEQPPEDQAPRSWPAGKVPDGPRKGAFPAAGGRYKASGDNVIAVEAPTGHTVDSDGNLKQRKGA